jgi:hypothetical protein
MVMDLLPKAQQKDVMEAMRERLRREAAEATAAAVASGEAPDVTDPEQLLKSHRKKLHLTCERIKRQLSNLM